MAMSPFRSIDMKGAWPARTPKSPSLPGTTTMKTSSERTSRSGVTSSKWRSATSGGLGGHALGLLDRLLDSADHVEGGLGKMVIFAVDHGLERADGVLDLDELARNSGEDLGDVEGLGEEALDLAGARDGQLI